MKINFFLGDCHTKDVDKCDSTLEEPESGEQYSINSA